MSKKIAILGTNSSVGKTTITTALCRYFHDQNLNVAPFKAFNLSSESFIDKDLTIGYAQYIQSLACNTPYQAYMNPILKKHSGDHFEVYVNGKVNNKQTIEECKNIVDIAFSKLEKQYDLVIAEGSGSIAELNIQHLDLANASFALKHNIPIILVADISKGGVFGNIYGHIELLPPEVKKLVKGIIINKFIGDPTTFNEGVKIIEDLTNIKVIGVVPKLNFSLPEEDSFHGEKQTLDTDEVENTINLLTNEVCASLDLNYLNTIIK